MNIKNFNNYKWASLLMILGPAYYWWDYPAPIFIAGIFFYIDLAYSQFMALMATSVLLIRKAILSEEDEDENKTQNLHG